MKNIKEIRSARVVAILGSNSNIRNGIKEYLKYSYGIIGIDLSCFTSNIYDYNGVLKRLQDFISYINNDKLLLNNINDYNLIKFLKSNLKNNLYVVYISDKKEDENLDVSYDKIIKYSGNIIDLYNDMDAIVTDKFVYKGKCKLPEDFINIPDEYKESIKYIYDSLLASDIRSNLLFLLVTGSCSRQKVYPGWSDIDIIIILESNNCNDRKEIRDILIKSRIKVGYTVFSRQEIESCDVDYKTWSAIDQVKRGYYIPTIYDKDLKLPNIPSKKVKAIYKNGIATMVHGLRRILSDGKKGTFDALFKEISHIMRSYLLIEDRFPLSYQDVFDEYASLFNKERFDVNIYIRDRNEELLNEYAMKFLDSLPGYRDI